MFPLKLAGSLLVLNFSIPLFATTMYDLGADWSNTNNPNGPWILREGNTPLPFVNSWLPGFFVGDQPVWSLAATGPDHVPAWLKNSVQSQFPNPLDDSQVGDVLVHSTTNGTGVVNVVWTSPLAGIANLNVGLWLARNIGRSNHFALYLNDTPLATGDLSTGDEFNRLHPWTYSGTMPISVGDILRLDVIRTSSLGEFTGVNLNITFPSDETGVPEPASWVAAGSGIIVFAFCNYRRRRNILRDKA
jgi:hypothetical protein